MSRRLAEAVIIGAIITLVVIMEFTRSAKTAEQVRGVNPKNGESWVRG